jgi:hypothetical protein
LILGGIRHFETMLAFKISRFGAALPGAGEVGTLKF